MKRSERRNPHGFAADRQREEVRDELIAIIDRAIDSWAEIDALAQAELSRLRGDGRGSGIADPTFSTLDAAMHGPANRWLDEFRALRLAGRALDTARAKVTKREGNTERVNTVERCTLCHEPAPKVKRIDGQPYCRDTCYFKVWRSRRAG